MTHLLRRPLSILLFGALCALAGCANMLDPELRQPTDPDSQSESISRAGSAPRVGDTLYFPIAGGPYYLSNGPHAGHRHAWDLLGDQGSPIRAVADGIVTQVKLTGGRNCTTGASCSNTHANYVVVEHNFNGRTLRLPVQRAHDRFRSRTARLAAAPLRSRGS